MTTSAQIIADSVSEQGIRLTTFQLRYPRFIHAELMTHRAFSRNASSSRAIPVQRMIEDLRRDPAMPVYWGSNKPGMQAGEELTGDELAWAKSEWLDGLEYAIQKASNMVTQGLHKQIANRVLEPWSHINVVLTATDYANFFALRCHKDAQPEIKVLADLMREAMENSRPAILNPGEWHLPYITDNDLLPVQQHLQKNRITRDMPSRQEALEVKLKVSVARCARVSYLTHDGRQTSVEEDVALFERLVGAMPLHASPAEHQATPDRESGGPFITAPSRFPHDWEHPEYWGNLRGWCQHRKMLVGEFTPG